MILPDLSSFTREPDESLHRVLSVLSVDQFSTRWMSFLQKLVYDKSVDACVFTFDSVA